jgi:hypothetical protein
MELATGPAGQATAELPAEVTAARFPLSPSSRHMQLGEVLEGERGVVKGQYIQETAGQLVQPGPHPVAFPFSFLSK